MATWVQAWLVVCLVGHTHGQLGVRGVGKDTERGRVGDTLTTTTTDQLTVPRGYKEAEGGGRLAEGTEDGQEGEVAVVVVGPWRWRPLRETYQGCYTEEPFNGTLMFVNLTQVMEREQVESVEDACFHLCHNKDPFSTYITVSASVSSDGSGDGCGCKNLLDHYNEVDGAACGEALVGHYRAYCGPSNFACLNRAGHTQVNVAPLMMPLIMLFLSYFPYHGA